MQTCARHTDPAPSHRHSGCAGPAAAVPAVSRVQLIHQGRVSAERIQQIAFVPPLVCAAGGVVVFPDGRVARVADIVGVRPVSPLRRGQCLSRGGAATGAIVGRDRFSRGCIRSLHSRRPSPIPQDLLLDVGENLVHPTGSLPGRNVGRPAVGRRAAAVAAEARPIRPLVSPGGEELVHIVMILERDANLLQIVHALRSSGRLAGGLDRRKKQGDQDADDRNHDQQLDQRKGQPAFHNMYLPLERWGPASCLGKSPATREMTGNEVRKTPQASDMATNAHHAKKEQSSINSIGMGCYAIPPRERMQDPWTGKFGPGRGTSASEFLRASFQVSERLGDASQGAPLRLDTNRHSQPET